MKLISIWTSIKSFLGFKEVTYEKPNGLEPFTKSQMAAFRRYCEYDLPKKQTKQFIKQIQDIQQTK